MASSLVFQPDRWFDCSLSCALLPDSYASVAKLHSCVSLHARHASLAQLPTTNHLQSCVCSPTSVSTVLHLHTCRGTVSHCLPTPVGLNCVLQKFISTTVMGSRRFYCAAPASWNDLPPLLRDPNLTLTDFRLILKTVLF